MYQRNKWNIAKVNWHLHQNSIGNQVNNMPEFNDTQTKYDYLLEIINKAAVVSISINKPFKI